MKIVVGKARYTEIFAIGALLESGREEMRTPLPPTDYPYALHRLLEFIQAEMVWVARVKDSETVVGILMLRPSGLWFVQRPHFLESVEFYVAPEYRKGGVAARLLEKGKEAALSVAVGGVPLVINLTSGNMAETKDRFVESQGFTYMGGSLIWTSAQRADSEPEDEAEAIEEPEKDDSVPLQEAV